MDGCQKKSKFHQRAILRGVAIGIAACAFALGLPAVSHAALLSIASGSPGVGSNMVFSNSPSYGIDLDASCSLAAGGTQYCVSVTAPGPLLSTYDGFMLLAFPATALGSAVSLGGGNYAEQYDLTGGGATSGGTITIAAGYSSGSGAPIDPVILSANVSGYSIFAANGGTTAQIQLNLTNATIGEGLAGFTAENYPTAYLLISGNTTTPVTVSGGQFTGDIDIDWSGTVSTTPYTPVPLPASGWLMLGALAGCGLLLRPRGSAMPVSRA